MVNLLEIMNSSQSMLSFLMADTATQSNLNMRQFWGIPVALVGAVLLSFGAQYQSRGLNKVEQLTGKSASAGLSGRHILSLFKRPSWVLGTSFLGLATAFQLVSLSLSPLIVVQPIGVVALIVTAILNSKYSGVTLGFKAKNAIAMSVIGITAFVVIAAFTARDRTVTDAKLTTILILFGIVLVLTVSAYLLLRSKAIALMYIIGSGVLYGFVATFAKTVIGRFQQDQFDTLTWISVVALLTGAVLGMVFVQNAYSSGPPDLVVAGLTVIDPLVAVMIGIAVLHEANDASIFEIVGFIVTGIIAMIGVINLAKYHPQTGMTALIATNTGSIPVFKKKQ
ncbi:MAG TPA: multidrug DMT transporter permease [Microbacteriaceae bacterium]|nr:multidrug DMT transporter permease [Microbacteriaceae bacterium]